MKLRSLIPVAALAILVSCGPSTYQVSDGSVIVVPDHTRTAFVTQYPTATTVVWSSYDASIPSVIDWELAGWPVMDESDYMVSFTMDNEPYYAYYDSDGNWVGTAYVVTNMNSLPAAINTVVLEQYPAYTISTVRKEFWKDRMAYEVELKNGDTKVKLLVDQNGNILKQKTKTM
jgi:hypothetical protein